MTKLVVLGEKATMPVVVLFIVIFLAPLVILGLIILSFFAGLRDFYAAVEHGIETEATVECARRRYVRISYYDATGQRHQITKKVLRMDFNRLREANTTRIVYLPEKPKVFFFAEDVLRLRTQKELES